MERESPLRRDAGPRKNSVHYASRHLLRWPPTRLEAVTRCQGRQSNSFLHHLPSETEDTRLANDIFALKNSTTQSPTPNLVAKSTLVLVARLIKSTQSSSGLRRTPTICLSILLCVVRSRRSWSINRVHVPAPYKTHGDIVDWNNFIRCCNGILRSESTDLCFAKAAQPDAILLSSSTAW